MKTKAKLTLTNVLLMVGFIPLIAAGILICVISGITTSNNLTRDVYDKLFVASEISSLAQQSDQSSKEIRQIVNEIIATSNKNVEYTGQVF